MFGNWTGESAIQYASVAGHKINKIANTLGIVMDIINVKEYRNNREVQFARKIHLLMFVRLLFRYEHFSIES